MLRGRDYLECSLQENVSMKDLKTRALLGLEIIGHWVLRPS